MRLEVHRVFWYQLNEVFVLAEKLQIRLRDEGGEGIFLLRAYQTGLD
jgi:hypothetical protein